MEVKVIYFLVSMALLVKYGSADFTIALYECPSGWEEHTDRCYRYVRDPVHVREEAKAECQIDGAYLLAINDEAEHNFVIQTLAQEDAGQIKQNWWTSGRRVDPESMEFYWEGDGTVVESYFYWHNESIPQDMDREFITYHFDGLVWAWILAGSAEDKSPFVCEISKDEIYKISQGERGPDYGVDNPDPETIERGPKFTLQPDDTIYEPSAFVDYVDIECVADSYPAPTYEWFQFRAGDSTQIDLNNPRYTLINGKLIIHEPATEEADDGNYQCGAQNKFGYILSNIVTLGFGFLQDFPKSPRNPVSVTEYGMASIECKPPSHYPDVLYTWYKDDIYNFIRPELKPYIFISHDGRLYFSEVTTDDVGQYFCLVYKPGQMLAEGKVSMPTELRVYEGSPGVYEPEMGSGFPLIYPDDPMIGDTIRLECWASGTSQPEPLSYSWNKVERVDGTDRIIALPPQSHLIDHNRVLIIPEVNLYDAGTYRCNVQRLNGLSTNETVELNLNAVPYYILPLTDQFNDVGAELMWRCEAGGDPAPSYMWYKNKVEITNASIPEVDKGRISVSQNVLHFKTLHESRDNGMYQCAASNLYGTRYSTAELRVLSFAPSFAKYPLQANQLSTEKGNTTLICRPEAAPYPLAEEILWYKNGIVMNPGGEDSGARVIKMRNGNLFMSPVQYGDSGMYKCEVSNLHGTAATIGNLTVLAETTITMGPQNENIYVNKTRFLHCVASYNPQLDVTYVWYQNDMLIDFELIFRLGENKYQMWYNPHYKRGHGIYNGGLYIMHAQYWHAGRYTCMVESTSGIIEAYADVAISGPPYEPAGVFHDPSTVGTSFVVLEWKESGNNGKPVISFVIEALNEWEGFWKIVATNVWVDPDPVTATYRFNVTRLRPYSNYELRVRAENEIGTSVPSLPSDTFPTRAVKPDKHPEQLGGGGGKVGDLVITWQPLNLWEFNGPGLTYLLHWKNRGDDEWDETAQVAGTLARYVVLVGEQNFYNEYEIAIKAFNNEGEGPMSPTVIIRSAMGLPTAIAMDVRAQPWNATACLVHWDPVSDTKDHLKGKLGGYRVSYWRECCEIEQGAPRVTINGQAEEGLVIGLYPDESYYFDVMVWNEAGNGPKSQYFIQRTLRNAPIEPPVEVTVTRKSSHAVSVWFRGVSTTNVEEPLEGYKVRLWRDGEHIKFAKDYDCGKETDLYIDDLRPDIMYKLRVLGYSRSGDGTMSSPTKKFIIGSASHLVISWSALVLVSLVHLVYNMALFKT